MRIDFHFYAIYALARAVGFSPDNAHVIAYASQYETVAKWMIPDVSFYEETPVKSSN
jgi:hypothetical protein